MFFPMNRVFSDGTEVFARLVGGSIRLVDTFVEALLVDVLSVVYRVEDSGLRVDVQNCIVHTIGLNCVD